MVVICCRCAPLSFLFYLRLRCHLTPYEHAAGPASTHNLRGRLALGCRFQASTTGESSCDRGSPAHGCWLVHRRSLAQVDEALRPIHHKVGGAKWPARWHTTPDQRAVQVWNSLQLVCLREAVLAVNASPPLSVHSSPTARE
jgi:hypothetical protein